MLFRKKNIMKINYYLLIFLCFAISFDTIAQSDEPCTAGSLTVNNTCSATAGTLNGATISSSVTNCASTGDPNVFYTFVATATSATVTVNNCPNIDPVLEVLSGPCAFLTNIACIDINGAGNGETANLTGLTIGNTYTVMIFDYWGDNLSTSTFDVCVVSGSSVGTVTNDDCSSANPLIQEAHGTCTPTAGTTVAATNSGITASCFGAPDDDVWYSFVATAATAIISRNALFDSEVEIFDACNGTSLGCQDAETDFTVSGLTIGNTYFVRIYSYFSASSGTFDICITSPPAPMSNDDCATATSLTVNPDLNCSSITSGTVFGATGSTNPTFYSCFLGTADDDVWYSFVASSTSHNISLTNVAGSTTDMYHSVYEMGAGCPGLGAEVICNDNDFSTISGLTIGNTYYVRVYTYTASGGQTSTFDICVTTPVPCSGGAGGNDCPQQQPICTDNSYCYTAGIGSTASSGNDYGCLSTQPNPSWYYFEISTAGDLIFDMSAGADIDYAVWGPFPNAAAASAACGSLSSPVDCSYSTSPAEQVNITGVSVGEVYIMVVTNFASVVQDISLGVAPGNTASTDCTIVNPTPCNADAGNW